MSFRDLEWLAADHTQRVAFRTRNQIAGITFSVGDDTEAVQFHQAEGHVTEVRDKVLRYQQHGFSSMPLPGAKAVAIYPNGNRAQGLILVTEDTRYRPKGLKPGEVHAFMVDGADGKGENGTLRSILKGLLNWAVTLFGKTINIGDTNTTTIVIGSSGHTTTLDIYATNPTIHTANAIVTNGGTPHPVLTNGGSGISTVLKADS